MDPWRTGAAATGWLLLILGGAMALIIGKGDIAVISAGIFASLGGIYVISLVDPATKQFIGNGWSMVLCRLSAGAVGLLLAVSGLMGFIGGIRETLIIPSLTGLSLVIVGLLSFCWGLYILHLAIRGNRP